MVGEDGFKQEEFNTDPLSAVREDAKEMWTKLPKTLVLRIGSKNTTYVLGWVKAFDWHCNMVLENVKQMWTELSKTSVKAAADS